MRYLKYLAVLAVVLMMPLAHSQAQVSVGIGFGPGYVAGPPVCEYGYYNYYPYACAPYGYYGPNWFVDGFFIGAGPWYHWGHPAGFWNRGYYSRGFYGRPGFGYRGGAYAHGYARGYAGGVHTENTFHGGGGFRGGNSFHRGGGFHGGGGGFHGGGHR